MLNTRKMQFSNYGAHEI